MADDVLAEPVRAQLLRIVAGLARPAGTQELAELVGRHPNTVRHNLRRLADAGLLERRTRGQARGRPRDEWVVRPGARAPEAYGDLARWLARALRATPSGGVERTGRDIGRELASRPVSRLPAAGVTSTFAAMGFSPRREHIARGRIRYVLERCPYRDAVRENQPAVCALHRGITLGLLDALAPGARLEAFVPRDPDDAGCIVDVAYE